LSRLENNEIITNKIVNDTASNNEDQSEIELSEPDLQLQVRKMNAIIFIMLEIVFLSYYYLIIYLNCYWVHSVDSTVERLVIIACDWNKLLDPR